MRYSPPVLEVNVSVSHVDPADLVETTSEVQLPASVIVPSRMRIVKVESGSGLYISSMRDEEARISMLSAFDGSGRLLWRAKGEPDGSIWGTLSSSGRELAVARWDRRKLNITITVLGVPSMVQVAQHSFDVSDWPFVLWAGKNLFVVLQDDASNRVWAFEGGRGEPAIVYEEENKGGARFPIDPDSCAVSPDGAFIAFSRIHCYPHSSKSGGVWMLNLSTGKCQRVTWEAEDNFSHMFNRWEGNNDFTFLRRTTSGQWDLWRARIDTHW